MDQGWAALLAGLLAGVAAIVGGYFGSLEAAKLDRERRADERRRDRERELVDAYVEWQAAVFRCIVRASELSVSQDGATWARVVQEVKSDHTMMGVRVELLETDSEARKKLKAVVKLMNEMLGKVVDAGGDSDGSQAIREAFSNHMKEHSDWLSETRFRLR